MNKPNEKKYQKQQSKTKNLHGNTYNSIKHNNSDKSNNLDEKSHKNSYKISKIIIIKMT